MSRQHAAPVLITTGGDVRPLPLARPDWSEADIQVLIQAHPGCLPIREIDPLFADPVPLARELHTGAGPIDNVFVTASGLPVLVECKLWQNPQARREVVGQIIDYAKEMSRWTASDLQREVSRRTGRTVLDLVRQAGHMVDEIAFNDALTLNLRRGRMLLLIVGDGIREGVEAIAEYLQTHAGLHFTLGLIELPIFVLPDGGQLVAPRVLTRTVSITRAVVEVPAGYSVSDTADEDEDAEPLSPEQKSTRQAGREKRRGDRRAFWEEFVAGLTLDDPDQPIPRAGAAGQLHFKFPAPGGSSWLTVYRAKSTGNVGLFLSGSAESPGQQAARALVDDAEALRGELGPAATIGFGGEWPQISQTRAVRDFDDAVERTRAVEWLRTRTNDFVNVLRPRIIDALRRLDY